MSGAASYIRDPAEIYRRSFETVQRETDLAGLTAAEVPVAVRLVHACGMPEIAPDLRFATGAAEAGRAALAAGAEILCDCEMVASGITWARLPADNVVTCLLNDPRVPDLARELATTRSAAQIELWRERLDGAVIAIGNAPTALFRLLEVIGEGAAMPAVVLGFPVGFVGAAESKQALVEFDPIVPHIALLGRRGGSAMASAAVNALSGKQET